MWKTYRTSHFFIIDSLKQQQYRDTEQLPKHAEETLKICRISTPCETVHLSFDPKLMRGSKLSKKVLTFPILWFQTSNNVT